MCSLDKLQFTNNSVIIIPGEMAGEVKFVICLGKNLPIFLVKCSFSVALLEASFRARSL